MIKTIKTGFTLLLAMLTLAACSTTSVDEKTTKDEVLQAFASLADASKALDQEAYLSHIDKARFLGLNSDGSNWNSFDDLYPLIAVGFSSIDKVTSLEFTNVRVLVLDPQTAILINEYEQSMLLKNGVPLSFAGGGTQVWSKQSGQWKLVSISASNKPSS